MYPDNTLNLKSRALRDVQVDAPCMVKLNMRMMLWQKFHASMVQDNIIKGHKEDNLTKQAFQMLDQATETCYKCNKVGHLVHDHSQSKK